MSLQKAIVICDNLILYQTKKIRDEILKTAENIRNLNLENAGLRYDLEEKLITYLNTVNYYIDTLETSRDNMYKMLSCLEPNTDTQV